jgi:hypothetical protein
VPGDHEHRAHEQRDLHGRAHGDAEGEVHLALQGHDHGRGVLGRVAHDGHHHDPHEHLAQAHARPRGVDGVTRNSLTQPTKPAATTRTAMLVPLDHGLAQAVVVVEPFAGFTGEEMLVGLELEEQAGRVAEDEHDRDVEADRLRVLGVGVMRDLGVDGGDDQGHHRQHHHAAAALRGHAAELQLLALPAAQKHGQARGPSGCSR